MAVKILRKTAKDKILFSDVFGTSSPSITQHVLDYPGKQFNVAPFFDKRYKHLIDEIKAAMVRATSLEQVTKLRESLCCTSTSSISSGDHYEG